MKLFSKSYDGGPDSGVTGYWLIEWKKGFSIVLLHFSAGSRKAYHSHAFDAVTFWLKGTVTEEDIGFAATEWKPGFRPKRTPKEKFHKVIAGEQGAWALSFRGPWTDYWQESSEAGIVTLTNGRVEVN